MAVFVVTTSVDENNAGATVASPGGTGLSLREALALAKSAAGPDIIKFDSSLSNLMLSLGQLRVESDVTIDGDTTGDRSGDVTIDASGLSRVFLITSGTSTLSNLAITGGNDSSGGGGVMVTSGNVTITNSTISGNHGGDSGGGVFAFGTVKLVDTTIVDNDSDSFGGGIGVSSSGRVDVIGGSLRGNHADMRGGGVHSSGMLNLINVTVEGNSTNGGGGGVSVGNGTTTLINVTVAGNQATGDGGGIFNVKDVVLTNVTVAGNTAVNGGGLHNGGFGSNAIVNSSTFSGNRADTGGGIHAHAAGGLTLGNTIVLGNSATANPELVGVDTYRGINIVGIGADLNGSDGVISAPTLGDVFTSVGNNPDTGVSSGQLADNGGSIETIAIKKDGIAHDAGNNSALPLDVADIDQDGNFGEPLPSDARGRARVFGAATDVGAFEGNNDTADTIRFDFRLVDATINYVGNSIIVDGPSTHTVVTAFERYQFTDGTVVNNDGNALVDDLFYYSQNHDVWNAHVDADGHFASSGWRESRDPNAFFSVSTYLSAYPDVKTAGLDPLQHFHGSGWQEGRLPSISFDPQHYLLANPDIAAAHIDPLEHFLAFGAAEGRQPFAPSALIAGNGFDYVWYLQHNPDVAAARVDPLQHFMSIGWTEGRNPNALFDVNGYLATYADVAAAHINPLTHYNQFGWQEGRDPSVGFDTTAYLAAYPDIAAAGVNPFTHFLQFGIHEGRSPFADGAWG